eukprot:GHVQ01003460.1.p3 GENE.GHVQ01003460.1~~GHVQ01003460.1.p3  ORF type:complete len:409 (+),score=80.69 GHVQ01003460.1:4197-5423(+)
MASPTSAADPMAASAAAVAAGGAATSQFQSRDEAKKLRDLEEARKLGIAPAEKDEEGRDINPHIPQYISKAPWYLNQSAPSLKHQRFKPEEKEDIHLWYKRGTKKVRTGRKRKLGEGNDEEGYAGSAEDEEEEVVEIKYRKGACENCGSMTHSKKDCVERPRSKGAKYSGKDLCPDEYIVPDLGLGYDGKRDRWAGYDSAEYQEVMRDYEVADIERKRRKAMQLQLLIKSSKSKRKQKKLRHKLQKLGEVKENEEGDSESDSGGSDSDSESDSEGGGSDEEDAKVGDFDATSAPMGSRDDRTRTTTRNLRIREDTAKYLFNLDVNSAFYDPKTRSMRDNPLRHLKPEDQPVFQGDNKPRGSGDARGIKQMELFAWQAYTHGAKVHLSAQPTQLEKMHKEHLEKKQVRR